MSSLREDDSYKNDIESSIGRPLNSEKSAQDLSDFEKSAVSNVENNGFGAEIVRNKEENPKDYNGFYNPSGKKHDKKTIINIKNLKKRSPIIAIIVGLVGGAIGIGGLASPALLLIHIEENFVNKYDTQNTSMTIRTNKLIAKKISADATSGACGKVQILCKFTRPSSTLLKNLSNNGIQALDGDGKVIDPKSWVSPFPNTQPKSYQFTDNTGRLTTVSAANFSNELNTNTEFRAAFHKAYNPRFIGYSDSVFKTIETRFGFDKSNKLADAKNTDDAMKKIDDTIKGDDGGAKLAASEGDDVAESFMGKLIKDQATKAITTLRNSSKGGGVSLAAGAVCLGTNIPGLLTSTARAYQMAQVIRYGMVFLGTASAMKAGGATPLQASVAGSLLTAVVASKSAMDSFGMKYSLFGDTKASSKSYQKFVPGGETAATLSGISSVTNSPGVRAGCNVATNPATGAALNGVLVANTGDTLGASLAAAALNFGIGWAAGQIITLIAPPVIDGTLKLFAPQIKDLLATMYGDITEGISGEDVGNALASGASNMMGQTANAGGNMPLTVDEAVAYNNEAQQVQLAYTKEDRITSSPLDPTNSSTFLGSIVDKLLPYYSSITSATGILSSLTSLTTKTFSSLFQVNAATVDRAQYSLCNDPSISANDIAAGPFCNIYYGVPSEYLDMDPETIVNDLVTKGDIDENTGDPIDGSGYQSWVDLCTDGDSVKASSCKITNQDTAEYSLYTIDHRIQKTMDGEDNTDINTPSSTAGNMIDQDNLYIDSTSVGCAPGTDDAGTAQGYRNGKEINIRLCSIPNTSSESHKGQPARVNSRVSGAFLALIQALTKSPANGGKTTLKVADDFRSMAEQQQAYAKYGSPRAALPGYSNHQMGLAIDFQLGSNNGATRPGDPVYDWLVANASTYGIGKIPSEAWHWQALGAD